MSSLVDIFIVLLIAHWNFETVAPKRVSILDTSEKSSLRWATWSNINNESRDDGTGWLEESVAHIHEGTNSRSYVTCDVAKDNVDNWLRLNFVPRGGARRLSIELKFTIRDCKRFPRTARTCKETFSLLYYETDDAPYDPGQGPKNATLFRSIDRITADSGRFSEKGTAEENVEVRTVAVTKRGVYFALRDEGACVSLLNVRIFYDVCEEVNVNFAWFPETAVGPSLTSIQEALGHCVTNASPPSGAQPKYVCKADGSWDLLSGGCQCNPGFRSDSQRCVACDIGTFKDSPGFGACQSCPDHSRALSTGSAICPCEAGYYRAISDSKSASCTSMCNGPPSRPENPQLVSVDTTSAVITWTRPSNLGGRSELWYTIVCQLCPSNVKYYPAKTKFNATKIILTNLDPSSTYTVFIYAENEVSSQIDSLPMYAVVEASTKHLSPMQISNFRIDSISENQIALSWDAPAMISSIDNDNNGGGIFFAEYDNVAISGGDSATKRRFTSGVVSDLESGRTMTSSSSSSIQYQIKIYAKEASASNVTFKTTIEPKVTVRGLSENVEYVFEVRPFVSPIGFGTWSNPKIVRTAARNELTLSPPVANSPTTRKPVLIALCVFGVVACVLFCVAVYLIWRRKRQNLHNRHSSKHKCSDLDALNYGDSVPTADYNASAATLNRKLTSSVPVVFNGINCKPYVDPTTYEDPCQALRDFANEIDENDVTIEDIIGAGEFGEVCKGKLRMCSGGVFCIPVAIKTLKTGSSEKAKLDFLTEASIMGQFNHPNVVKLKGVVTKCEPVMIITEYMDNGSLDNFLRVNDGKFNAVQLVSMLRGIAQGMKYLSEKCYVHRDLAARNVLVDAQLTCKIADFGLSRTLDGCFDHAYTTKGGKIPIRWTAPEAITYRKFTSASDVWSYGIVMWEVMSFGERPYGDWANQDVIQHVEQGYRLPPPMDCPTSLHRLMLECWNRDRQLRPTFASIVFTLSNYLHCPELLYAVSSSNSNSLAVQALIHQQNASASNLYQPNSTQLLMMKAAGVDDFLRQIGLYEKYAVTFRHHGVKSALALSRLNRNDFSTWGVKREDQEKIFDALHYLQLRDRRRSVVDCRPVDRPNAKTAAADSIAGRRVSVFGDSDLSFLS